MRSSSFLWPFSTEYTNTSAFCNLCFSYMQSNWFTPLNMCQVSDMQPSITAQQQLRLIESWCSSAGPQCVSTCSPTETELRNPRTGQSLGAWYCEPSLNTIDSTGITLLHTTLPHKSSLVFKSNLVDWTICTLFIHTVLSISKLSN